jgi:(p)ppGpp synthase/HD superfamily hydrolase
MRKGTGTPYMAHLLSVCSLVMYHGGFEDEAIAALLHDALEDASDKITPQQIGEEFSPKVQQIVQLCSDTLPDFRGGEKEDWQVRKDRYLEHVRSGGVSPELLLVSVADKVDNAGAIVRDLKKVGDSVWARFKAGKEKQLWYYRELVSAYRAAGVQNTLLQRLDDLVKEMQELAGG